MTVSRIVDAVAPGRMGVAFRWLLGSTVVSNLGDGIAIAAGPLLVASETQDPVLVAAAALLERLPWLLFGLWAGALADRLDRRLLVVAVDGARAVVLGVLTVTILTGTVNVAVVLGAMFLLGLAEVFADTAAQTLLPMVVGKSDLGIGNARMMGGFVAMNQMIGPAVGAVLYAAGRSWPFLTQAVCVALGALLIARMRLPVVPRTGERPNVWRDIGEGLRWTWSHAAMRTLTLTIVTFNVTFGAAMSVLVLYADQRLHAGAVGFGLLSTFTAIGGIAGMLAYDKLARRFSLGDIMRVGLIIETLTHLALALTTMPAIAYAIMFVFGAHAFVWGTTSRTVRMRSVPLELQGRVSSLYMIGVFGGLIIGQGIGGVVARIWGVTGPFWFAFGGSAIILALIWRELALIAHDAEETPAPGNPGKPENPAGSEPAQEKL